MAYPSKCFDEEIVLKADLEAAGSELLALPSSLKKLSDLLEVNIHCYTFSYGDFLSVYIYVYIF